MIPIQSQESRISFLEFTLEINKDLVHALKTYAKVKDGSEEKTKKQWTELYKNLLEKKTTTT